MVTANRRCAAGGVRHDSWGSLRGSDRYTGLVCPTDPRVVHIIIFNPQAVAGHIATICITDAHTGKHGFRPVIFVHDLAACRNGRGLWDIILHHKGVSTPAIGNMVAIWPGMPMVQAIIIPAPVIDVPLPKNNRDRLTRKLIHLTG